MVNGEKKCPTHPATPSTPTTSAELEGQFDIQVVVVPKEDTLRKQNDVRYTGLKNDFGKEVLDSATVIGGDGASRKKALEFFRSKNAATSA